MSFPKAKIHRFNEITTCAPPPGKYDPKFDDKVKGAVIEKSKRFISPKSVTDSDTSSCCSRYSPAVFRTPQLPKKKFATPRSEQGRFATPVHGSKSKKNLNGIFNNDREQNLIDQINELTRVHSSQLIEKDQELHTLLNEVIELKSAKAAKPDDSGISNLEEDLRRAQEDLENEKTKGETLVKELKSQIRVLEENLKNSNSINSDLEYQLAENTISLIEMKNHYAELERQLDAAKCRIESLKIEKEKELKQLKERCAEEVEGIATAAELNVELLSNKFEERVRMLERELDIERMENHVEFTCKLDEIVDDVKGKVVEYETETEAVVDKIKSIAVQFEERAKELMESIESAQHYGLDDIVDLTNQLGAFKVTDLEQKMTLVDLQVKIDELELELGQVKKQCRKYEIVQNEATKTIQVLSKRLFESETDVERLNEANEEVQLRRDALEEKIRAVVSENVHLKNSLADLQVAIIQNVKEVEADLLAKVDSYKRAAADEAVRFKRVVDEKQRTIEMMLGEIDYYKGKATESSEYVSLCQSRISDYKDELKQLSGKINDIEDDYNDKVNAQKTLCMELQNERDSLRGQVDQITSELEETKAQLKKAVEDLETAGFEHERQIEDLALKLDHYTECGLKTNQIINSLKGENEALTVELKEQEEAITEKDLKIESLSSEISESKNYVQSMTEHVVSLMNELAEKDRISENLNQELEVKSATLVQVSEEYEEMKRRYEEERLKMSEVEKDVQESQKDNEKYIDELISELVLEKERCSELSASLESSNSAVESLTERIKELEETLTESNQRLDDLEDQVELLEASEVELKDEIFNLNQENEAMKKRAAESESAASAAVKKMEELNGEKEDLVGMIKRQWEEMELLTNEISNQQELIDELKQTQMERVQEEAAAHHADLQNEIAHLHQTLEDAQRTAAALKTQNEDLTFKLKSAEVELTEAENEKKADAEEIQRLNGKIQEVQDALHAMEKRKNEYKIYAAEVDAELQSLQQEIVELVDQKDKLKDQCTEDSMKVTSLTAQIADLECRNQELETIIGPFREQLLQFESERSKLLMKTENTEKELQALALEHARALGHQNHRQKIKHVIHLTETISNLKKEMEKLRTENTKLKATLHENKEPTLKRSGSLKGRKDNKENGVETSPLLNKGRDRQSSPANPLKQRNVH